MKLALCLLAKNEELYIQEFLDHYKNLGIDKIYIYDNNDSPDQLPPYVEKYGDFVEIIPYNNTKMSISVQKSIYTEWYNKYKDDYDWMMCIDADEFITLKSAKSLKDYLSQDCFAPVDKISLCWMNYCSEVGDFLYRPVKLVDRLTRLSYKSKEQKTIIRGGLEGVIYNDAHIQKPKLMMANSSGEIIEDPQYYIVKDFHKGEAWINHYMAKTLEEWCKLRLFKPFGDGNRCTVSQYIHLCGPLSEKEKSWIKNWIRSGKSQKIGDWQPIKVEKPKEED